MTGLISALEIADGDRPDSPSAPEATGAPQEADDLSLVRELVLKAHPDVVPELIGGDSVASIVASISPAQAAYSDLAARIQANSVSSSAPGSAPSSAPGSAPSSAPGSAPSSAPGSASNPSAAPRVPAGSAAPAPLDPDRIPAAEKIRRGVRDRAARAASRGILGSVHGIASRDNR